MFPLNGHQFLPGIIDIKLVTICDVQSNSVDSLSPQSQLPHADQVLRDLQQALLALLLDKPWPVDQIFIDLSQSFLQTLGEFDFLPHVAWETGPFHCFHVEEAVAIFLPHCGILTVCQGARRTATKASYVVLIPAESLSLGTENKILE